MPYNAVLHITVGNNRGATVRDGARSAAAGAGPASDGQAQRLASTRSRLSAASRPNTASQPNDAAISAPSGAPNEREQSSPDTASASQVARRAGGALSPTRAYIVGETPAVVTPATVRAAT